MQDYVARILDAQTNQGFLDDFRVLQQRISHGGLFNALSQTLLKITTPGVPDTYQGTELWDLSLVDPDNRRPVDYAHRHRLLHELQTRRTAAGADRRALVRELLSSHEDGRLKLYVTALALACRRRDPGLFATGAYLPVQARGAQQASAFGFVRRQGSHDALVVVPRRIARLLDGGHMAPLGEAVWQDTTLLVPDMGPPRPWHNVLTGESVRCAVEEGHTTLAVAQLLAHCPVALLMAEKV